MNRNDVRGFTLIELMIVVAIIAIIAAIAIPSLLRSRIAANESSAVGTLRSLVTIEASWRQTDVDRNTLSDYWTADVSGFWRVERQGAPGTPVALMDAAIAQADCNKVGGAGAGPGAPVTLNPQPVLAAPAIAGAPVPNSAAISAALLALGRDSAKSGYWFRSFDVDASVPPSPYPNDPDLDGLRYTNTGSFAFAAFPETYDTTGTSKFIANEAGVIFGQDLGNNTPIFAWPGVNPTALGWRLVQ